MTDAQNGNGQALAETNADGGVELKEELQHRKYRATDLPLTAAQRQSIDSLLYRFKKGGDFDHVRKRIWADFSESEAKEAFTKLLLEKAEAEIDREPSLLSRERGKAATLIEGAIDRSDFYKSIEDTLDNFTSRHLESILQDLRGIRRTEVGDEQALAEEERGKKSDEEYKSVVEAKRREREIAHLRELEARKQKEIEEAKKEAEEAERRRELKRKKAEEERRLRDEREERRRAERDQLREEQRRYDDDRERDREERYERRRREDSYYRDDRDRRRSRSRALPPGDRWEPGMDRDRGVKSSAPVLDDKSLEDAALELLLKEGKELAEKSRVRPEFDFERVDPDNAHVSPSKPKLRPPSREPEDYYSRHGRRGSSVSHHYDRPRIRDERDRMERDHRTEGRSYGRDRDGAYRYHRRDSPRPPSRREHPRYDYDDRRSMDRPQVDLYRPGERSRSRSLTRRRRSRSRSVRRSRERRRSPELVSRRESVRDSAERVPLKKEHERIRDPERRPSDAPARGSDAPDALKKPHEERESGEVEELPKVLPDERDVRRERAPPLADARGRDRSREAIRARERSRDRIIRDSSRDRIRDYRRVCDRSISTHRDPSRHRRRRDYDRESLESYRPRRYSRSRTPIRRRRYSRSPSPPRRRRSWSRHSRSPSPPRRRRSRSPGRRPPPEGDRYLPGAGPRGRSRTRSPPRRRMSPDRERRDRLRDEFSRDREREWERSRDIRDRPRDRPPAFDRYIPGGPGVRGRDDSRSRRRSRSR